MNPDAKKLLNSLRCPICKGQLDLLSHTVVRGVPQYNFFCVNDYRHYGIFLNHWDIPIAIEEEGIIIFEGSYRFDVLQKKDNTKIIIREIDPEERVLDSVKPKIFEYDKELFIFSKTTKDKIVNRIKTILVFQ